MNTWIIGAIVIGLLVMGSVLVVEVTAAKDVKNVPCEGCQNKCSADSNCGLQTCGALNGGTCGCGS